MAYLLGAVLSALLGLALQPIDVAPLESALVNQTGAGTVRVTASAPVNGRLGEWAALSVSIDQVEVKRLPLEGLLASPVPRTPKARLGRLDLMITRASLDGVVASAIEYHANGLTYDLASAVAGRLRISGAEEQTISITVHDGGFDDLARQAFPELTDPHITFEDGQMVARAKVNLLLAAFPVRISGRLAVRGGSQLVLLEPELDTGRLELGADLKTAITKRLDPLVDLEQSLGFPLPVEWSDVEVTKGQLTLTGRVTEVDSPPDEPSFQPRWRYRF